MVFITVDLIRKRCEHNEGEIGTLEEISLHQENIEKIDHLQNWCRNLQILLLQSNLISKIENLNKLKRLRYLNLALNNIERIEGLSGLESLEKLDLTLNFIADLKSVAHLKDNLHLECLILIGNPCADYRHYRDFVTSSLTQIKELDGKEVTRSERILAKQNMDEKLKDIDEDERKYRIKRKAEMEEEAQREEVAVEDNEKFWNQPSKNTPEERVRIAKQTEIIRAKETKEPKTKNKPENVRLFNKDGKPLNVNQPKIPFKLYNDEEGYIFLEVEVYKYLDTSYINVDIQPKYVTITIKGQILQLVLDEEIQVDKSTCKRSQTTGHLQIKMTPENFAPVVRPPNPEKQQCKTDSRLKLLEVDEKLKPLDLNIVNADWRDNPEVPPLV